MTRDRTGNVGKIETIKDSTALKEDVNPIYVNGTIIPIVSIDLLTKIRRCFEICSEISKRKQSFTQTRSTIRS